MKYPEAVGAIAVSKKGRDAGKYVVAVGVTDDGSVLVADGRLRKVVKPKKKNLKHLVILDRNCREAQRLIAEGALTDLKVRGILEKYRIYPQTKAKE